MHHHWQCGGLAYLQLPPGWKGVCSLVTLQLPIMVVPANATPRTRENPSLPASFSRHRRAIGNIWPSTADIPYEYRLFSKAQLAFTSLFASPIQVSTNALWLEKTRYELALMVNDTEEGLNAIREELRGLRLMTMQNRYVLDLSLAKEGGVCAKVGSACCTFVAANDDPVNGSITKAIDKLKGLQKKIRTEGGISSDFLSDWLSGLPSWVGALFRLLAPIIAVLLLVCCSLQVIVMCVKRLSKKVTTILTVHPVPHSYLPHSVHLPYVEMSQAPPTYEELSRLVTVPRAGHPQRESII